MDQNDQRLLTAAAAAISDAQNKLQALSTEAKHLYQQRLSEWEQCRHTLEQLAALLNSQTVGIEAGVIQGDEAENRKGLMADEARLRENYAELAEAVFRLRQIDRLLEASARRLEADCQWLQEGSSFDGARDHDQSGADCAIRILQAREQERLRLAREIHDGPAQVLANAVFELEYFERLLENDPAAIKEHLAQLKSDIRNGLTGVRRSIFNLRPPSLSDVDFFVALRRYLEDFGKNFGLKVVASFPDKAERLPPPKDVAIFRIFQETLQNIQKHADAKKISVKCTYGPTTLKIQIEDDGHGFDPAGIEKRNPRSMGIVTMRERAELIDAQLDIHSSPGHGTRVILVVPLASAPAKSDQN
ncbi:MAG: sensor histidine kinase [Chloroflexota bacterium]